MWICPKCGEPHQDQFKECWKCAGKEMEEAVAVGPPPPVLTPSAERKLRPLGAIFLRAVIGFLVGGLLSLSSLNLVNPQTILPAQELSPAAKSIFAVAVGLIFGLVVGLFFWVVLPYEPTAESGHDQPEAGES